MRRFHWSGPALLLALLMLLPASARALPSALDDDAKDAKKEAPAKDDEAKSDDAEAKGEEEEKPKFKKFDEVTKETELVEGFFDVYSKPGTTLLAIDPDQFGLEFIMVFELSQGVGARGLNGGTMLNIFQPELVRFERHGDNVMLIERPYHLTNSDEQMQAAMEISFSEAVIAVAEIQSEREDGALLIDVGSWLLSDTLMGIERGLGFALSDKPGQPARVTLDPKRSYVEYAKSFPENTRFRTKLTYGLGEPPSFDSLADDRNLPISIHTNFVRLPEEPMKPRLADDRMGYFLTVHKDFGSKEKEWFTRYINRWRLEKGKKRGDLHEPKEPIVYYIDHTVPERYRKTMMQAIENWQKAYEAAGWKNAIRAEMLPKDADAEDIRYPTVRWMATDQPSYLAIGPSVVDPRTGEILDADILFDAAFVLRVEREWTNIVDPVTAVSAMVEPDLQFERNGFRGEEACFAAHMGMQIDAVRASMLAAGTIHPGDPLPDEFVQQFLYWVTMHEAGHSLGLRHNFRSSTDTPMDKLQDVAWTEANGLVSSVMDYAAANIAPAGQKTGLWYGNKVGTSDEWVISYGYTADDEKAAEIARQGAATGHAFASDEERAAFGAMDPSVNAWDLGSDPLAWSKQRVEILEGLLPQVPSFTLVDNAAPSDMTMAMQQVIGSIGASMTPALKCIGGQYTYRDHVGDPNGRAPFVPVARARQVEALGHIVDTIFDANAFDLPSETLAKMGARRWLHWGSSSGSLNGRLDYPYHETVAGIQEIYLRQLLSSERLSRMSDAEIKFGSDEVLTVPELYDALDDAVWSDLSSTRAVEIPSTRRNLQRAYVDQLSRLIVAGPDRLPPDARSLARAELRDLKDKLGTAIEQNGPRYDRYTNAHLADMAEQADRALNASLSMKFE